jgi:hypothetical protein
MEVEITRDWVDYLGAAGVLVSLLLAAGALIYAKKSSDAARGSEKAAETTAAAASQEAQQTHELLRIAKDQHERLVTESSRRPVLAPPALSFQGMTHPDDLTLGQLESVAYTRPMLGQPIRLWPVVVQALFENIGDKAADRTLARFLVPLEVGLLRSGPRGEHAANVDLHRDELILKGRTGNQRAHVHAWRIQHLPPGQPEALHVLLLFTAPGDYEAELQAQHEEAEPVSRRFLIRVPASGAAQVEQA